VRLVEPIAALAAPAPRAVCELARAYQSGDPNGIDRLSADQVAEEYGITRDDVLAALAYAAKALATEQVRAGG
jgi:hypothetical protein